MEIFTQILHSAILLCNYIPLQANWGSAMSHLHSLFMISMTTGIFTCFTHFWLFLESDSNIRIRIPPQNACTHVPRDFSDNSRGFMVLAHKMATPAHRKSEKVKLIGIPNLGGSCYCNSLLQCLHSIRTLTDSVTGHLMNCQRDCSQLKGPAEGKF